MTIENPAIAHGVGSAWRVLGFAGERPGSLARRSRPHPRGPARPHLAAVLLGTSLALSCGVRSDLSRQGSVATGRPAMPGPPVRGIVAPAGGIGTCVPAIRADAGITLTAGKTRFVLIGDYGNASDGEAKVAAMVKNWAPDFIVTTGDNNYPSGAADTIDAHIGQFFHDFIGSYRGKYGCGAAMNRFFPSLGNHDWYTAGAKPYRDYFALPGNERYYDAVVGDVHLFAIDSDPSEPDGVTADSVQATWLKGRLAASTARWRIVYMHHPPYSSGPHQSTLYMRWPFKQWGASMVFAGHDHIYERLDIDGLNYVVNGLGGAPRYAGGPPIPGSVVHYDANFGVTFIEADATMLSMRFLNVDDQVIDQLLLKAAP